MPGETLHAYDLDLCDYVLGNVRQYFRPHDDHPADAAEAFAGWLRGGLPPALGAHLFDDPPPGDGAGPLLLNDAELYALAGAVLPPEPELDRAWLPDDALYERSVLCVGEITARLTKQVAEEWSEASARYAARLSGGRVWLWDGIDVVREWLRHLRRLKAAMGASALVPRPDGGHPTPTTQGEGPSPASAASPSDEPPPEIASVVHDLRKLFVSDPGCRSGKTKAVARRVHRNYRLVCYALRWLEARGEYRGHSRPMHARYRAPDGTAG